MATNRHRVAALAILLAFMPLRAGAHDAPAGTVTVGVDPAFWDNAVAGMQLWTDTGYVTFVPVEGCGNGEVNICWGDYPDYPERAGWWIGTNLITVADGSVGPGVYCHELGHWLGLRWDADGTIYHRSDYLSCMSNPYAPDLPPDDIDLAFLGYARSASQVQDGTGGPAEALWP